MICHLTRVLKRSCDVETALDSDRTDPHEGVGRGLVQSVVLLTGVIISLVPGLHSITPVHIIVGTDLEQQPSHLTPPHPPYLGEPTGDTH